MNSTQPLPVSEQRYDRIGGWLILVGFGLIISPLRLLLVLTRNFWPIFSGDTWSILTTPGTAAYHPLWAPLLIVELMGNLVFVIFPLIVAVFFFQRRKITPELVIIYLFSALCFTVFDYVVAQGIPFLANESDPKSVAEMIRSAIICAIWIPYFLMSKRVKGTFVH